MPGFKTPPTLRHAFWQCPRASPATALLFRAFKGAVCQASKLPQPSATPFGNVHEPVQPWHFFLGHSRVPFARLPNSPNPPQRLSAMSKSQSSHGTLLFKAFKGTVCQAWATPFGNVKPFGIPATAFYFLRPSGPKPSKPFAKPFGTPATALQLFTAFTAFATVHEPVQPGHFFLL